MITIVDSGISNVGSVLNMLKRVGVAAEICADLDKIARADRLVLPGVGAFDEIVTRWSKSGLVDALNRAVLERETPCLGICLGMQVMARSSEEGILPGFGWLDAQVIRFRFNSNGTQLKIPHMGWNSVQPTRTDSIFSGLDNSARFYFVHSYHLACTSPKDILATTDYGGKFTCAIQSRNIAGVQFHPEKSHKFGLRLLENFARWKP